VFWPCKSVSSLKTFGDEAAPQQELEKIKEAKKTIEDDMPLGEGPSIKSSKAENIEFTMQLGSLLVQSS
jgi:hypothetical protein